MDPAELLDHPIITQRYFFPRRDVPAEVVTVDVGAARLACFAHTPHPDGPTLLHFHGNGEVVADWAGDFAAAVADLGCNLFLAEFRGYGGSTGTPGLAAMLGDVDALVHATGVPVERLIAFGRSVGSIYAIHCVHRFGDLGGLILESGIADPLERLLLRVEPHELGCAREALEAAAAAALDHRAKLAGYGGPVLVMHAANDFLVDVSHGRRLHAWAAGEKRLVVFDRGDHNSILASNWNAYFEAVAAFVRAL